MTHRERLEARADRRREWAEKRVASADAAHDRVHAIADQIPFGQPILVGHHSERRARADQRRMHDGMSKAVGDSRMAARHEAAADSIERQLRTSIFSDDADAVEQLQAKVARLEAKRASMKAANAAYRSEHRAELKAMTPYERSQAIPFPSYSLTNLGATIRNAAKRIEQVKHEQAAREAGVRVGGRVMESRYPGECADCGEKIERGDLIVWFRSTREAIHHSCEETKR